MSMDGRHTPELFGHGIHRDARDGMVGHGVPSGVDVPDLARRLLPVISTCIHHRAVLAAARAAGPPGNVSATGAGHACPGE
jgi:hypothetical protein